MRRSNILAVGVAAAFCAALFLGGCAASESYTPPEASPSVTSPTLLEDGVLKVGVDAASAPLAGQPENSSKIVGIDVDIAAALADELGLKVEVVDVGSDPEAALKEKRVDVVMGIDATDASSSLWVSESYLPSGVALFTKTGGSSSAPSTDSTASIAAQISSKSAWAAANAYKKADLVTADSLESAFSQLDSGEVDYVASDLVIGTYAAHSAGEDVESVALLEAAGGYCIGVSSSNTQLQSAVTEAVSSLADKGIVSVIEAKWLGGDLDTSGMAVVSSSSSATNSSDAASTDATDASATGESATDASADGTAADSASADSSSASDSTGSDSSSSSSVADAAGSNAVSL